MHIPLRCQFCCRDLYALTSPLSVSVFMHIPLSAICADTDSAVIAERCGIKICRGPSRRGRPQPTRTHVRLGRLAESRRGGVCSERDLPRQKVTDQQPEAHQLPPSRYPMPPTWRRPRSGRARRRWRDAPICNHCNKGVVLSQSRRVRPALPACPASTWCRIYSCYRLLCFDIFI